MKIQELVQESISYTQYEDDAVDAIYKDIDRAVKSLSRWVNSATTHRIHADEIKQMHDSNHPGNYDFLERLQKRFKSDLMGSFNSANNGELFKLGAKIDDQLMHLSFYKIDSNGEAGWNYIDLSTDYLDKISDILYDYVLNVFGNSNPLDSINEGIKDFEWAISKHNERKLIQIVKNMSSTFIHEMVHLTQHSRQKHRKRTDPASIAPPTEYRSYLDKKKGEFVGLTKSAGKDSNYTSRWYELWAASPQEIAAISHQITLKLIDDYGLVIDKDLTRNENLENIKDNVGIAFKTITHEVNNHLDKIANIDFSKIDDPKARKVYQRYVRLVYQELERHVNRLIKRLND
jgi:hypothetical protein